jgi:hypothetical protein
MPFGKKMDESGRYIDFDKVYEQVIAQACAAAGLEAIRADEEVLGGVIHKPMFERLILCDYAVADLSTANANVFYELGIRHGIRPHSTVLIFGSGMRLPFDVAPLRGLPYQVDSSGNPCNVESDIDALSGRLNACRDPSEDSPLFQLISSWPRPDIKSLKVDTFRDLIEYANGYKGRLREARKTGEAAIFEIERELNIRDTDPTIVADLFLSYRAVGAWKKMVDLTVRMSTVLFRTVMVQEQFAMALNRLSRWQEAEDILHRLIAERGPSSETNGILGRVYKDRWEEANKRNAPGLATGYLRKAIEAYLAGFESDWRDAYPGLNAVTLMEMTDPKDPRRSALLPVVAYSIARRLESALANYWDYASLLELHVASADQASAMSALPDVLAEVREVWEPETTSRNLRLIRERRMTQGIDAAWIVVIEDALLQRSRDLSS